MRTLSHEEAFAIIGEYVRKNSPCTFADIRSGTMDKAPRFPVNLQILVDSMIRRGRIIRSSKQGKFWMYAIGEKPIRYSICINM